MELTRGKIIIYGHTGWIGKMFISLLKNEYTIFTPDTRVENYKELEKDILAHNPDFIICCTGRTCGKDIPNVDYLQLPEVLPLNIQDNLQGPLNLAILSDLYDIHLTYIGTGCIFDYDQDNISIEKKILGFNEDDLPNFMGSNYSIVKGKTDELLHNFSNVLNCRIRMPIIDSYDNKNLITKLVKYNKICSNDNSMTVLDEILPIIVHMMKTNETGTYNMTNPGYINHNDILDIYKFTVDPSYTYENFTIEEYNSLKSKRCNVILSTVKLQLYCEKHNLCILNIKDSITNALKKYSIKEYALYVH